MDRYYRLKKDTSGLLKGAILRKTEDVNYYSPMNELYHTDSIEEGVTPRYTSYGVEHAPDWYERVYPVNLLTKTVYKLKEEAKQLFEKEYTE